METSDKGCSFTRCLMTLLAAIAIPKFNKQATMDTKENTAVNWIGHFLRMNCLLKQVIEEKIEGKIQVTVRRGRRRK